jgi:hypothetical protein
MPEAEGPTRCPKLEWRSPCQAPTGTRADRVKGYTPALNERRPEPALLHLPEARPRFTAGCSSRADARAAIFQIKPGAGRCRQRPRHGGGLRKRHGDCNAAQAQSGGGAPACSPTRDQVGPFAAGAEAKVEMTTCRATGTLGLEALL